MQVVYWQQQTSAVTMATKRSNVSKMTIANSKEIKGHVKTTKNQN